MGADGPGHLLIFGFGYSARALAPLAIAAGWRVTATKRDPSSVPEGRASYKSVRIVAPEDAAGVLGEATHLLVSAPPLPPSTGQACDPLLRILDGKPPSESLRWIGYFSTTGVYGDRGGGWVDEDTEPAPTGPRGRRRLDAEREWARFAAEAGARLDLMRLAGIYGPGRSVFDSLRDGTARRVAAPGHCFGRIHRDDIAAAAWRVLEGDGPERRVLNFTDDLPAESAVVLEEAARLLGLPPPPLLPLAEALETMSPMGRSFWADNRKVRSQRTQEMLGRRWTFPTYKEGLRAILSAESSSTTD